MSSQRLAIRWTIGNVSRQGWEALRLSIWGAWRLFGEDAIYVVCVNSISLDDARRHCGQVPDLVGWRDVTGEFPSWMRPYLDNAMAEGVGWKLAPIRLFPDMRELSLDNDCILVEHPERVAAMAAAR